MKAGTYGTLYLNSTSGAYEYTPDGIKINGLSADEKDTDVFQVLAKDGGGLASETLSITINLQGANDTPEYFGGATDLGRCEDTENDDVFTPIRDFWKHEPGADFNAHTRS